MIVPFLLLACAGVLSIGTKHATVAGQRTQYCATTGAVVLNHSGIDWYLYNLDKLALRAGKFGLCDIVSHAIPRV